jgi:hypothetical protein
LDALLHAPKGCAVPAAAQTVTPVEGLASQFWLAPHPHCGAVSQAPPVTGG